MWLERLFQLPLPHITVSAVPPRRTQETQTRDDMSLRGDSGVVAATRNVEYSGGLIENLGTLMSAGADVTTLWNRPVVDTEAMLQGLDACPDMNWADRGVVLVRLIYNTLSEARSRAALLMCNTWDAARCTFVPVLSHNMLTAVSTYLLLIFFLVPCARARARACYLM